MTETTTSHPSAEAYFPMPAPADAAEPARNGSTMPAVRTSPARVEASRLLLDGQQLLQESRWAEAEPLLLRALEIYEQEADVPADCVQVLSGLASIATTRGDLASAESLFQRALALANVHFGGHHSDVATMLGGLARLYLRQGEFGKAEPLLHRLLDIKRARGDDHPEVATVLASLATVHSAMGAHESSERILRRVLAIRERTLAPNHFATMTTLEHLAESCAARGKFEEALTLLHRALAMRDRTLGPAHPSIVIARTRIADLELLSSNEGLDSVPMLALAGGTSPELHPSAHELIDFDSPAEREALELIRPTPRAVRGDLDDTLGDEWDDTVEKTGHSYWLLDELNSKAALVTAFARTPRGRLTVVAVGVASLLAALTLAVRSRADVAVTRADASILSVRSVSSASRRADADGAPNAGLSAPRTPGRVAASADSARGSITSTVSVDRSAGAELSDAVVAKRPDPIALPNKPKVSSFEVPIGRSPVVPVRGPVVASEDFAPLPTAPSERSAVSDSAAQPRGRTVHAVLPADNPAPEYPRELMRRHMEGRVMAEFLVDKMGRVDTRTLRIISSTDQRFSQAVRDVLPSLRFLPAERDGVKIEEWVAMPFRFSKPK